MHYVPTEEAEFFFFAIKKELLLIIDVITVVNCQIIQRKSLTFSIGVKSN